MLYLHHGNDIRILKDHLVKQLQESPLTPLQAEHILVQNPGMKRYLQQQISTAGGIAANMEFPLPSRFIWDIFLDQFDDVQQLSAYDAEVLRWWLLKLLQQHLDDPQLSLLKSYQQQDDSGVAAFQLAERLALLFDQYLVYRPQMINQWERLEKSFTGAELWQSYLWRLLRTEYPQPHRAELIQRLIKKIDRGGLGHSSLPPRLFVFALSAMSPMYMNVLAALAEWLDVHIYIVNPSRHYWGDILSHREQIKRGQSPFIENELLASLGRQGRDYIDEFYNNGRAYEDYHHFTDITPDSLLNLLKHDILNFTRTPAAFDLSRDDSIQLVSCYSEVRELQSLHDYLLKQLQYDTQLQPHDIVVMCPDINQLAPYIDAVFGEQTQSRKIPYSISDHNVLSSTPLLQAILEWINLPASRFTATDISGWLELPALQRAYQLDDMALQSIRYWIAHHHIRWGRDAAHRNSLGFAADDLNTWAHGIRQLISSYLMPQDDGHNRNSVMANVVISQQELIALGQLQKLLDDLAQWQQRMAQPRELQEWQGQINDMIDQLLQLDEEEEWLITPLRDEMATWQQQVQQASYQQPVEPAVIHHLLHQALQQGSTHHYYLSGGVNFCNLIPMRTLPFKVVCLIGMGNQQFPRSDVGLQIW